MALTKLYIFVEGHDDYVFFSNMIVPLFKKQYDDVEILQYAQMKKIKSNKFVDSIITLGFDYLIVADIDEETSTTNKKRKIQGRFPEADFDKMVIVIAETESWFIAGLKDEKADEWKIEKFERTELITKEVFNQLYGRRFHSRIDFLEELMKQFDYDLAMKKNVSFEYFIKRYIEKK